MFSSYTHVPALDGVRGIAILLVLFCHFNPLRLAGGNIGVDLFFVLSGFLITSILLREHSGSGVISIARFYMRRALRLLPALYLVVAFVVLYAWLFQPPNVLTYTVHEAWSVVFYYFNWHRVAQVTSGDTDHQWMFSHLWSLSVEEQFYLVWPLCMFVLLLPRAPRLAAFIVIGIGIAGPALGRALIWETGASKGLYFSTLWHSDGLMWGALGAWLTHFKSIPSSARISRNFSVAAILSLVLMLALAKNDLLSNGLLYRGGFTLVGLLSAIIILAAVRDPSPALRVVLENKVLCWVGKVSYGLYLWHWPCILICQRLPGGELVRGAASFAMIFSITSLSFYFVEQPFLALKDRLGHPKGSRDHLAGTPS
jgi:peptidoglycan/LPS O-acetylase OafA/YrhL